jgi:protocatechuate 3,4-dioxygenase beta subunit
MRRFVLAWLCGVAVVAHLVAQPQPEKKTRLEGRVVGINGEAVRKATVRLQANGQPLAVTQVAQAAPALSKTTDDTGKFAFEDVPAGRYTLISEKAGFLTQRYGARSENGPGVPLNVVAGTETKGLELKMTPQGIITGRVTDEDGDPIAGAPVSVARYGYSNGHRQLIQTGGTLSAIASGATMSAANALAMLTGGGSAGTSDDQGNFRIVNLAPGRYYVSANPQGASSLLNPVQAPAGGGPSEPISITTYYPSSPDAQGAAPVDVAGGSEVSGINIRVRKQKVYSIRGKVADGATGGAAAGATILFFPLDGSVEANPLAMISNMARPAPDGTFEVRNLLPGQYAIQGLIFPGLAALMAPATPGAAPAATPARPLSLDPLLTTRLEIGISNADVAGVVLQLTDGTTIPGTVTVEDGKLADLLQAPQQNQGTATPQGPPVAAGVRSIRLTMADGPTVSSRMGNFAEDGVFKITGVEPTKYFVNITGLPPGTYAKSVKFAGQDITKTVLDMTSGAAGALEVVLSPKAADLTGVVHNDNGDPLPGIPVTLWPKTPDHGKPDSGIKTANTDQNGSFKLTGLAPGEYYVAAWDYIPVEGLTQNPDFLARFAGSDSAVKLAESGHQTADTKLIPRDRIVAEAATVP